MKHRLFVVAGGAVIAGVVGHGVASSDLVGLYDLLLGTAGIIFGVAGAWIALVHAAELKSEDHKTERLANLVGAMISSAWIVFAVLVARGSAALLASPSWKLDPSVAGAIRGFALAVWVALAASQASAMFAMVPSARHAIGEILQLREFKKLLKRLPTKSSKPDKQRRGNASEPAEQEGSGRGSG